MSFERKISQQSLTPLTGSEAAPVKEQSGGSATISGGPALARDRGHENHGQTIHTLFELGSSSRATRYLSVPSGGSVTLEPGKFSHYIIRLNGNATIELAKPPAVPQDQWTKTGKFRTRSWDILVQIYQASASGVISWNPAPKVGASGFSIGEPDPETGAQEISRAVDFPGIDGGPSIGGTADLVWLQYNERNATWFGVPLVRSVEGVADPISPDEDATEPEPEEPGEDEGTTTDTEEVYEDPETGEDILPVEPDPRLGNLIAMHPAALSVSEDCGASWKVLTYDGPNKPTSNQDVSALTQNLGTIVLKNDGSVIWSGNLRDWQRLSLGSRVQIVDGLNNGDFEETDLRGWTLNSGIEPVVTDTTQPAQRAESVYYLTNDKTSGGGDFTISQPYNLPTFAAGADDTLSFSADMFAETGATAKLAVIDGREHVNAGAIYFNLTGAQYIAENIAVSPTEGPLRLVLDISYATGAGTWIQSIYGGLNLTHTGPSSRTLSGRVEKQDGTLYSGTLSFRVYDLDGGERMIFTSGLLTADVEENGVTVEISGSTATFTGVAENVFEGTTAFPGSPTGRGSFVVECASQFVFTFEGGTASGIGFAAAAFTPPVREIASVTWNSPAFTTRSIELAASSLPSKVGIAISGVGTTARASVYIDNVRVSRTQEYADFTNAIASDRGWPGFRHVMCTQRTMNHLIIGPSGGLLVEEVAELPYSPSRVAARGNTVVISGTSGAVTQISVSTDNAQTFSTYALSQPVVQLYADPAIVAVLADGTVISLDEAAEVTSSFSLPGGPGSRFFYDRARKWWLAISPTGELSGARIPVFNSGTSPSFSPLGKQPVKALGFGEVADTSRRVFPTAIGRLFGFQHNRRDLFWTDDPTTWNLGKSLTSPIGKIVEVL